MSNIVNLENARLEKILRELYTAQKCTFFLENAMGRVIDKLGLSEEEAIEIARALMEKNYIATKSFLPATFLRPNFIRNFPVVLSAKAIAFLKSKDENNNR
ncbi:hypothetical protein IT084_09145 [Desulfallas sp. Bu1-1]|jgi:hypothetical protein|uniref:hypothetical protein n=1 Tax=Desulfallas sp. Bu1-1 TaxID=2787620 RepID=UPI00189D014B|nr:hypothetical protein [Desulfallas sp. Bu1-1]MBF7083137.1 hypothetical protein [Desulfallas sp. Bu1-1]